jgi:Glutamate synthase central domain
MLQLFRMSVCTDMRSMLCCAYAHYKLCFQLHQLITYALGLLCLHALTDIKPVHIHCTHVYCIQIVETAQAWSPHHFAALIGYGASAVHPYLALESVKAWQGSKRTQMMVRHSCWHIFNYLNLQHHFVEHAANVQ